MDRPRAVKVTAWGCHAGARVTVLRSAHDCWFPDWQAAQIAHAAPQCQARPTLCAAHALNPKFLEP